MPRTYGEIQAASFADIFALSSGSGTVFIDCGSGHGLLTKAAVEEFGCSFALGIEKYKEPFAISAHLSTLKRFFTHMQSKLSFVLEDILDTDYRQQLTDISFNSLLLVCNNLAFQDGTLRRSALGFRALMDSWPDKRVTVVSTRPLEPLEDRRQGTLQVAMSWSQQPHDMAVYRSPAT